MLCTWTVDGERTRLDVSGPLAILRQTTKYSHALARFFPALMARARMRVEAQCVVRDEAFEVHVTSDDPLCRHGSPASSDTAWRETLARAIDRLGTGWSVVPAASLASDAGQHSDLVLRRGETLVLIEVIRFHRFRRKIDAAALLNDVDALVGIAPGARTLHAT